VRAYIGTAEIVGTLVFAEAPRDAREVEARLHLRRETVIVPGAPFVVRRLSPKDLLGGGTLSAGEALAPQPAFDDAQFGAILRSLGAVGLAGADAARLGAAANVREDVAEGLLAQLVAQGRAVCLLKPPAYADAALVEDFAARVLARLAAAERIASWAMGVTLQTLARGLAEPENVAMRVLAALSEEGRVAYRQGYYATPQFVPELTPEQRAFFEREFPAGAVLPVPFAELTGRLRASEIPGISQALETLLAGGALVKVGDAAYRGARVAEIRALLESALRRDGELTMAAFRDLVGTSRKYAVPLLEWFDANGVTLRTGDVRVLRGTSP
jgi:selenocysteine-specific elongation factor